MRNRAVASDRVVRVDELEPGMLLKFRDGSYRRVVSRATVLSQRDGTKLMVPRLPELPPEAVVAVCEDRRRRKGTLVGGWLDDGKKELLIALHEDPPRGKG
jgi:hypothetical protein